MGFVYDDTLTLEFYGPKLEGLEVKVSSVSIVEFFGVLDQVGEDGIPPLPKNAERLDKVLDVIGGTLLSWNIDDVDCDIDGLRTRPSLLIYAIVESWIKAQAGVSGPLVSTAEKTNYFAPAVDIPMEPLAS